jgi:nicotinate phosphoribosyltransferase
MKDYEILEKLPERQFLDNDLYKFSMMWFIMCHFPDSIVRYEFIDRRNHKYPKGLGQILRKRIDTLKDMKLSKQHRNMFQSKCSYLPNLFFDFLEGFRLDPNEVSIFQEDDGRLRINIDGYWYRTVLWEIILMSEISEINFLMSGEKTTASIDELHKINIDKTTRLKMNAVKHVDFGTRRRYSFDNQKRVVRDMAAYGDDYFVGSSNVLFALETHTKIIGTFAHEVVSAVAAMLGYSHANKHMMELWVQTFGGNLGIVLTDTFGLDAFLKDFDAKYARLFDGVRHDSGDPKIFADRIVAHYISLGIDPMSKTIVFSDGLDVDTAIMLSDYCRNKIKTSFGIGTHFTNDLPGIKALNIVIKLFMIDGKHVIKLSDVGGKNTGDEKTVALVKELIDYKPLM